MAIEYNGSFLGPEITAILVEAENLFDVYSGVQIASLLGDVETQSLIKKYVAKLTQTSTNIPVATIIENTLGTITFGRVNTGIHQINSSGLFTTGKTFVLVTPLDSFLQSYIQLFTSSQMFWLVGDTNFAYANGGVIMIEIRVYP